MAELSENDPEFTCSHCGRDMRTFDNVCSNGAYCFSIADYKERFRDARGHTDVPVKAIPTPPSNGGAAWPVARDPLDVANERIKVLEVLLEDAYGTGNVFKTEATRRLRLIETARDLLAEAACKMSLQWFQREQAWVASLNEHLPSSNTKYPTP